MFIKYTARTINNIFAVVTHLPGKRLNKDFSVAFLGLWTQVTICIYNLAFYRSCDIAVWKILRFIANNKASGQKDPICYYHFCFTQIFWSLQQKSSGDPWWEKVFEIWSTNFRFVPFVSILPPCPIFDHLQHLQQLIPRRVTTAQYVWLLSQFMNPGSDYKLCWSRDASSGPVERGSQVLMISFRVSGTHSAS